MVSQMMLRRLRNPPRDSQLTRLIRVQVCGSASALWSWESKLLQSLWTVSALLDDHMVPVIKLGSAACKACAPL